ncbi:MAG: hypothetical protein QNJ03_15285 [Dinoroseobacter sp.]|nr:hypothetical protein [Dinoroseobacter sp.]
MFARVTPFKMKASSTQDAIDLIEKMKPQIMALGGMVQFTTVMNEDGSGYVVSVIESEAQSEANQPHVAKIWGAFADHLEAMPVPQGFPVVAHWAP